MLHRWGEIWHAKFHSHRFRKFHEISQYKRPAFPCALLRNLQHLWAVRPRVNHLNLGIQFRSRGSGVMGFKVGYVFFRKFSAPPIGKTTHRIRKSFRMARTPLSSCKHHSTETVLLYIHDHLINAIGSQLSYLCLLDLSAALTPLTIASYSPACHLGSASMALCSTGLSRTCHLAPSASDVITLFRPTPLPVASPKASFSVLCFLSWTLPPSALSSCLLYTSPSPRDRQKSRMPSSA